MSIDATAIVHPDAKLAEGAVVGPFCIVGEHVTLGEGVQLHSHVVVKGRTRIGARTQLFPFVSVGHPPQDLKFDNEPSEIEVGEDCMIREHVTINPGTEGGTMLTKVGDRCLLMVGVHVAHDCLVGANVILSNNVNLAGHCTVGDFAIVGGLSGVHQFVRIGAHAFVGGVSAVVDDVIPYGSVLGNRAHLGGLNLVGLRRRGFDREAIHQLRAAYRMIFESEGTLSERLQVAAQKFSGQKLVEEVIQFIRDGHDRAICTPRNGMAN